MLEARDRPLFLRHLARRALDLRPPTGFFRDLVVEARGEQAGKLEIKRGGIVIVGELARAWAVEVGAAATGTIARLDAAAAAGRIDEDTRSGLAESYRLLWEVRLAEHVRAYRAGEPTDDFVDPTTLGALDPTGAEGGVPDHRGRPANARGRARGGAAMTGERIGRPPPMPPAGSKRRPWNEVELVALDFETTGLDFAADSVISWGTVPLVTGGIELRDAAYQLVAPGRAPGVESIRVHELRPVDLASAPALEEVAPSLRTALGGRFLVAWAAGIERAFLRRMFGGSKRSWRRRTIDVRELAAAAIGPGGDARRLNLEAVCRKFGVPVERTHHAFDDALMTAELFLVLAGGLAGRGSSPPTVKRLLRTARHGAGILRS